MSDNLNLKAFKRQLKDEITTDIGNIIREVIGEMLQIARRKQPIDLDKGETTVGKPRDRDDDLKTVLANPLRQKFQPTEYTEKPGWAKKMAKMVSQMQLMMKEKGMVTSMDYTDLDLDDEDPLLKKFRFPDMNKYSSTKDPHLH